MAKILDKINKPKDIHKLEISELEKLSSEVRDLIIHTVSERQGHLASNLGVVELTIALHYCFNLEKDHILWDVGHQSYTHKILTGRKEEFKTLREYQGLSGFPNKYENRYDPFTSGHSGSAISSALGLSCGKDILKKKGHSIAVVGDGGIGTGVSLEALNHAGDLKSDLIVVLNDNNISISSTVGAVSKYLNSIRTTKAYSEIRKDINELFQIIPAIGKPLNKTMERTIELVKKNATLGNLFMELGFNYFGPTDGHDFNSLIETINAAKKLKGPILLHTFTEKGKGFEPAFENPTSFHSAGGFDTQNGLSTKEKKRKTSAYTDVFAQTITKHAKENKKIVGITAAMPDGTGLKTFAKKFPERFYDTGICEQHAVSLAGGLSVAGLTPVVAIYSTFLQRGYDQIFHDICLQNNHVVFAIDRAGIVGPDGATHNGCFDITYLRHLPNMTLMAPKDGQELKAMFEFALNMKTPVAIRYPRENITKMNYKNDEIKLGKSEILKEGKDALILAYGSMVSRSIEASKILKKKGLNVGVINSRFAKPLDEKLFLEMIDKYEQVFTVEENSLIGGFGSAVLELISDRQKEDYRVHRMGIPDKFIEHGKRDFILKNLGLDPTGIAKTIEKKLRNN